MKEQIILYHIDMYTYTYHACPAYQQQLDLEIVLLAL
jgi:hypothetical protein